MVEVPYDLIVVGGGPAGLAAAGAAAERGRSVMIIDPRLRFDQPGRHEFLPQAAKAILLRLGLSNLVEESVALESVTSLWESGKPREHSIGLSYLTKGWSVDRQRLEYRLAERLESLGGQIMPWRFRNISKNALHWSLSCTCDGKEHSLAGRYVIDATGRGAHVARRLGTSIDFGPELIATIYAVDGQLPPHLYAEACEEGWWYALPGAGGQGTMGYLTSPGRVEPRPRTTGLRLFENLVPAQGAPWERRLSLRGRCDARSSRLRRIQGSGWLATGDAAGAFDPVSSQGLFNALSGGFFAGKAAVDVLDGDDNALTIYVDLLSRTLSRTHRETPLQYANARFHTSFWKERASGRFGGWCADE